MIFDLAKNFADVLDAMPQEHPRFRILKLLDEAIRRDVHFIDRHPTTFFQCMWNTCWWYDCPEAARHYETPVADIKSDDFPWNSDAPLISKLLERFMVERVTRERVAGPKLAASQLPKHDATYWLRTLRPPSLPLASSQLAQLKGHTRPVKCVAFSVDGKWLASGSDDGIAHVWDCASGEQLLELRGHTRPVSSVTFSPDGKYIVTGSWDGSILFWDRQTGTQISQYQHQEESVSSVAFSPDGQQFLVASGQRQKIGTDAPVATIVIRDSTTGMILSELKEKTALINQACYSSDGSLIAVAFGNDSYPDHPCVKVWNSDLSETIYLFEDYRWSVNSVSFSPDGNLLASGESIKTVRVWNLRTGKLGFRFDAGSGSITSVAFTSDGSQLVCARQLASNPPMILRWDTRTWEPLVSLRGHKQSINQIAVSSDCRKLATASDDMTLRIWNTQVGHETPQLAGHSSTIVCLDICPKEQRIATGSSDGTLRIWNANTGEGLLTTDDDAETLRAVAFAYHDHRVAAGSIDRIIRVWEATSGKLLRTFTGHQDWVNSVVFSQDDRFLASASNDKTARLWDANNGNQIYKFQGHSQQVNRVAFSSDGKFLASSSSDNTIRIWNTANGKQISVLTIKGSGFVMEVEFTEDNQQVIACCRSYSKADPEVRVWSLETEECIAVQTNTHSLDEWRSRDQNQPFLLLSGTLESQVVCANSGRPVTWLPNPLLRIKSLSSGYTWVGAHANDLLILELEVGLTNLLVRRSEQSHIESKTGLETTVEEDEGAITTSSAKFKTPTNEMKNAESMNQGFVPLDSKKLIPQQSSTYKPNFVASTLSDDTHQTIESKNPQLTPIDNGPRETKRSKQSLLHKDKTTIEKQVNLKRLARTFGIGTILGIIISLLAQYASPSNLILSIIAIVVGGVSGSSILIILYLAFIVLTEMCRLHFANSLRRPPKSEVSTKYFGCFALLISAFVSSYFGYVYWSHLDSMFWGAILWGICTGITAIVADLVFTAFRIEMQVNNTSKTKNR